MTLSAKWREDGVPRNCFLAMQCSYVDVLSVRHGNAGGIQAQLTCSPVYRYIAVIYG